MATDSIVTITPKVINRAGQALVQCFESDTIANMSPGTFWFRERALDTSPEEMEAARNGSIAPARLREIHKTIRGAVCRLDDMAVTTFISSDEFKWRPS